MFRGRTRNAPDHSVSRFDRGMDQVTALREEVKRLKRRALMASAASQDHWEAKIAVAEEELKAAEGYIGVGRHAKPKSKERQAARNAATKDYKARYIRAHGFLACEMCGWYPPAVIPETAMHIHHIVPVSCGGLDDDANLIVLCPTCHTCAHYSGKSTRGQWTGPSTRESLFAWFDYLSRENSEAAG